MKKETQTEWYNRKIDECEKEALYFTQHGDDIKAQYWYDESVNYKALLKKHLSK